jgi:glycerate 2-kinase
MVYKRRSISRARRASVSHKYLGMQKILIAPDSFKGSLTSPQAANAIQKGILRVGNPPVTVLLPIADGGEGTGATLCEASAGTAHTQTVTGPLGEQRTAYWYLLGDQKTAVVELAEAAGLTLILPEKRDPKITTTYGVGELIHHALTNANIAHLIITLGGSATNDGGAGILQALTDLATPLPTDLRVTIACDVDNSLIGPRGASAVFGPQKGATVEDVVLLDARLTALKHQWGLDDFPGAGAAGGAAYGLKYKFPQAQIRPGIDIVLDTIDFDTHLKNATLIITGEGRMDAQTLGGKAIVGICRRAKHYNIPVVALVGGLGADVTTTALTQAGIAAVLPITPRPMPLEEAMSDAETLLADAAERLMQLLTILH